MVLKARACWRCVDLEGPACAHLKTAEVAEIGLVDDIEGDRTAASGDAHVHNRTIQRIQDNDQYGRPSTLTMYNTCISYLRPSPRYFRSDPRHGLPRAQPAFVREAAKRRATHRAQGQIRGPIAHLSIHTITATATIARRHHNFEVRAPSSHLICGHHKRKFSTALPNSAHIPTALVRSL